MTAEELLADGEVYEYSNVLVIDAETREINIPLGEEFFGVEGDVKVERKYFSCPKVVGDNIDLSECNIYINYILSDKEGNPKSEDVESYFCDDLSDDGDNIKFTWVLSERVLAEDGFIAFAIVAKKSIDGVLKNRWYTTPGVGIVKKTIKDGEELQQQFPDVIDNLINRVKDLESVIESGGTGGGGDTKEQIEQIETNKKDIARLSEEIDDQRADISQLAWEGTELSPLLGVSYYYPEQYGAVGDGVTDDTEAFSEMFQTIKSDSDTFLRTIVLSGRYVLNEAIEIIDRLKIKALKDDQNKPELLFGDSILTCFVETETPIVSGRIWNFELDGIVVKSNNTIFSGSLQWWRTKFTNCTFESKRIFEGCLFYLSTIKGNQFSCPSMSTNGFTLNDSWFMENNFNFDNEKGDGGLFMYLKNSGTSRITDNYFTLGNITSYSGTYTGIRLENCNTLMVSRNVFDTSNGSIMEIRYNSKFIVVENNVFRGWGSMANYDNSQYYIYNPAIYVYGSTNIIVRNNTFSKFVVKGVFPSLTNKSHYLIQNSSVICEKIDISGNLYEDNLIYYEGAETFISERLYGEPTVFTIPS